MGFGSMLKDYLEYHKISQTDFAMRLGISTKHLNEIVNGNSNLSLELMHAISLLTDIDVNLIFYVENKKTMQDYLNHTFQSDKEIKDFLNHYFLNEMNSKNWIVLKDKESLVQNSLDLLEFLGVKDFGLIDSYIDKRIKYKKKDNANITKIYLWIKHCDKILINQKVEEYKKDNLTFLLEELQIIRNHKFNSEELVALFNKYGIYLVIEDALPKTKVRGAMMVKNNNPAIYLTKYYREKSSFYFALYHELGHVKSDYNQAKSKIIVEDSEEEKCDTFALNQMIPSNLWEEIKNSTIPEKICKENQIPLCFLYSRMAYEGIISYSSKEYNKHKEMI